MQWQGRTVVKTEIFLGSIGFSQRFTSPNGEFIASKPVNLSHPCLWGQAGRTLVRWQASLGLFSVLIQVEQIPGPGIAYTYSFCLETSISYCKARTRKPSSFDFFCLMVNKLRLPCKHIWKFLEDRPDMELKDCQFAQRYWCLPFK